MTSTIKVNNIQNQCGQNIINENSNTITIGASGDTIALASGASQSGFGREGSVNWQTGSLKTTTFTAANGEGYFINSGSALTMNLPAGSAGAIVAVADYARNFATYNFSVSPNGSEKIGGTAGDAKLTVNGQAATFVYVDSTKGWVNVQNAEDTESGTTGFIMATGGTTADSGNCRIHTFTSPGTFSVSATADVTANNRVSYLVVAGGAGGGWDVGGGGGAGGFRESQSPTTPYTTSPLVCAGAISVTATDFPITVGAGGAGASAPNTNGSNGVNSIFSSITSAGGGGGGGHPGRNGSPGGSGGGGSGYTASTTGGTGNTPPTSPAQGKNGGNSPTPGTNVTGGGGGGATANGACETSPSNAFAAGGAGATTHIVGTPTTYSEGGRGAGDISPNPAAGADNTGDGGDGAGTGPLGNAGPNGGSGIVIIRYKFQ